MTFLSSVSVTCTAVCLSHGRENTLYMVSVTCQQLDSSVTHMLWTTAGVNAQSFSSSSHENVITRTLKPPEDDTVLLSLNACSVRNRLNTVVCGDVQQHVETCPLPHSALQRFYKTCFYTEICAKARGAVSRPAGRSTFSWFLSGLTGGTQFHVPLVRVEVHPAPHLYFNLFQSNFLKNVMKRLLRGLRHSECWEWWCCSHCSRRRIPGDDHTVRLK